MQTVTISTEALEALIGRCITIGRTQELQFKPEYPDQTQAEEMRQVRNEVENKAKEIAQEFIKTNS